MRILSAAWECPNEPYGGLGVFLSRFLPEAARTHDVVHYCMHGSSPPLRPITYQGVRVVRVHEPPIDRGGGVLNLASIAMSNALVNVVPAFDVAVVHDVHASGVVITAVEVGVRVGYYIHMFTTSPLDISAVLYSDSVMSNSYFTARQVRAFVNREDLVVVYPASPYPPADSPSRNDNEVPVIVIPSRYQHNKSPEHVMGVLESLRERLRFRVVVFGRGSEYYRLPWWVENLGTVSEDVKTEVMRSADLVLQVGFPEPFGLVPLEAVSLGVPALVSSASGASEVFPKEACYTVEDLEPKLEALLTDRTAREELWWAERRSWIMSRTWKDVWEEVERAVLNE